MHYSLNLTNKDGKKDDLELQRIAFDKAMNEMDITHTILINL